jgi:iron complex outermembrane receptor protein
MFFNKLSLITLIFLSQILPKTSSAQESAVAQLTESDFFNDFPIVLTATRLKQSKKNSPTATTIIDRKMIEASGFTDIVDLLRLAPGMLVNYDSGHIGNAGYQFLFDRYKVRLQVLVDGMSVYTPIFGGMPWTQLGITIDDIERIEVIRGPSSASYGPNAMTGVISIITRHATLDKGLKFKVNQGVNGRSEQYATMGDSNGNFDYKLSLGARKDDGFKKRHDSKELSIANFRGDYQASNNDVITFSLNYNSGDYQEDGAEGLNDSTPDHIKNVRQTAGQTKWVHSFSDGDTFTLNYYQQTFKDKNIFLGDYTGDSLGFVPIDESVTTRRKNLELSYSTYSDEYSLTFGALYRKDNSISPQFLYNTNKDIDTKQLFVNAEFQLNKDNVFNLGILHDDNDAGGATTSPRIALNHHINKNHTARISYAESTRSPFALEEYTNYVIYIPDLSSNLAVWSDLSDLKPERIKSLDIGYIGSLNNNATEIDMRIYKNWLTDIIVLDSTIGSGGFLQGDEFNITGFEATLSHKFENTKVIFNYARTIIKAGNLTYGKASWYETGAPKDIISLLITHNFGKKVDGSLGYYYTGSYQQLCCEVQQQAPRKRLDLTLSKTFKLGEYNSKIKFVLQNATNEKTNTRLFNNYDRQGYISFSLEL